MAEPPHVAEAGLFHEREERPSPYGAAGTSSTSQMRNSVSTVGDYKSRSSWLESRRSSPIRHRLGHPDT
jgi:hypothetical protein